MWGRFETVCGTDSIQPGQNLCDRSLLLTLIHVYGRPLILLSCVFSAVACGDSESSGGLYVSWNIGTLTCEEAGVSDMRIALYDFSRANARVTETGSCTEGSLRADSVPSGEYTLILDGLNSSGCVTYRAEQYVRIPSGQVLSLPSIAMPNRLRALRTRWALPDQKRCSDFGVDQVAVRVKVGDRFDQTYFRICDLGQLVTDDLVPIGPLSVTAVGLDRDGNGIARAEHALEASFFQEDLCHDQLEIDFELTPCEVLNCLDQ